MKKTLFSSYIILLLFAFACSNPSKEESQKKQNLNSHQLIKKGTKTFALDSLTSYKSIRNPHYFSEGGINYFSFLNPQTSSIYLYDYKSTALKKIIKISKQGPNAIEFRIDNYYIHNLDSIFIISDESFYFYLIDQEAKLLKKYFSSNWNTEKYQSRDSVFASAYEGNAALVKGKYIYFHGNGLYNSELHANNSIALRINLETGKSENMPFSYPKFYQENYFGRESNTLFTTQVSRTYNPNTQHFVYAFPALAEIYVTDINYKGIKTYYAGSNNCKEIKPLSKSEVLNYSKSKFRDRTFLNSRCYYSDINYHPYQDFYYRKVYLPEKSPEDIKNKPLRDRTFEVILLDKDFQKIGEQSLERRYRMFDFVAPAGIHFIQEDLEDEDFLVIDIYELSKK